MACTSDASGQYANSGASDRRGHADQPRLGLRPYIQCKRSGMIAAPHPDPADSRLAGLDHCQITCRAHRQMTQTVVAVDYRRSRCLTGDLDLRPWIATASTQPRQILPEPKHSVRAIAKDIGLDHQPGNLGRVILGHAFRRQRLGNKASQCLDGYRWDDLSHQGHRRWLCARKRLGVVSM